MITEEMRNKFGTIQEHKGSVFSGKLDLNNPRVVEMAEKAFGLFLNSPPAHFIGTFLYFYHVAPEQENPITISAYEERIDAHPGQGRLIASCLRGDTHINSIFIPLNEQPLEVETLKSIAKDFVVHPETVYDYDNQNHHGTSTKEFELYFYPTDVRLSYEKDKDKLLYTLLGKHLPITWKFKDRDPIKLGEGSTKTVVKCKNPRGFFESVARLGLGHFKDSMNYGIKHK